MPPESINVKIAVIETEVKAVKKSLKEHGSKLDILIRDFQSTEAKLDSTSKNVDRFFKVLSHVGWIVATTAIIILVGEIFKMIKGN